MNPSFNIFKKIITNPIKFRFFLFTKLPAAFFAGLRIHHFDDNSCVVRIRYSWFTMNPFKSIYFAVEAMAAEMCSGMLAFGQVYKRIPKVSMLVVKMEVALGVHEMRRHQPQLALAQAQACARVGHADDPASGLADLGEVRRKALPDARDHQLGGCGREPSVQRGNDVRVGVRSAQVGQLLRRKELRHRQQQLIERQVAARVDDGPGAMVHDQKLVRLDSLRVLVHQIGKHQANVMCVAVKFNRHWFSPASSWP